LGNEKSDHQENFKEAIMTQTLAFGRSVAAQAPRRQAAPSLWQRFTALFQNSNERLQTIRQLNALSDEMLRDIGVERQDIEHSVDVMLAQSSDETSRTPR
jgi:uncharacterized protein YjiS (DUF1127 family)